MTILENKNKLERVNRMNILEKQKKREQIELSQAKIQKQNKWDMHYLTLALVTSYDLSKDPSSKAGCVIVHPDNRQLSTGYNGFPVSIPDTPERWGKPAKYQYVIHSEENAVLNAKFDTDGATAYVSWQPCIDCMRTMLAARIHRLVYYGFHPKYPNGQWDQTDQPLFNELASYFKEVVVIPKNEFLENIRALYPPLETQIERSSTTD